MLSRVSSNVSFPSSISKATPAEREGSVLRGLSTPTIGECSRLRLGVDCDVYRHPGGYRCRHSRHYAAHDTQHDEDTNQQEHWKSGKHSNAHAYSCSEAHQRSTGHQSTRDEKRSIGKVQLYKVQSNDGALTDLCGGPRSLSQDGDGMGDSHQLSPPPPIPACPRLRAPSVRPSAPHTRSCATSYLHRCVAPVSN